MIKKAVRTSFVCSNCGAQYAAWAGRCGACSEWNTIEEEQQIVADGKLTGGKALVANNLHELSKIKEKPRLVTRIGDIDMVLGGGFVPGSTVLVAGQPGIGKSTLMLQIAASLSQSVSVLYVSGEESLHQLASRAQRLGVNEKNLSITSASSAEDIAATIASGKYALAIIDSIQTTRIDSVSSAPGSVSQIMNSSRLISLAGKQSDTTVLLVGHVTKEGSIAGPKVLEHLVDVVVQLEGERYGGFKILRGLKNRFGSTNESSIFEMTDKGLAEVKNPSEALLAERQITDGSVVLATMEGTRPLLVEVQALVNRSVYGYPKRTASGIDANRLNLLIAVLERRTKLKLSDQDIFINIVGGIEVDEPAADLAVVMAIGSAAKGLKLSKNAVVFGEVGLSGEVRHVPFVNKRIAEAKKLGFTTVIGPIAGGGQGSKISGVSDVKIALNKYLKGGK